MSDVWARLRLLGVAPRTIRSIAIAVAICTALVTACLGRITLNLVHRQLELRLDTQIQLETRTLHDIARRRGLTALVEAVRDREHDTQSFVERHARGLKPEMAYLVVDGSGRRQAGNLDAPVPHLGYEEFIHFRRSDGSPGLAQGVTIDLGGGGRLVVAADRAVIHRIDERIERLFAVAFFLILAIGVVAIFGLGRIFRSRLHAFEKLALGVTAGNIEQRMPLDGSGIEFDRLAGVINAMMDRIAVLVTNLREVSAALAHDLRTPLARIRSRLELLEASEQDIVQKGRLSDIVSDVDGLLELFSGLLALSELDAKTVRSRFEPVDLGGAISDIAEAHRPAIEDSGRHFDVRIESAWVHGDQALLQRLAGNLIDNAMTHTPPGTRVEVCVGTEGADAIIRVADDGPGVSPSDHDRIFDRLVRLDASRTSPGHGLGLSIVSAIVSAHGGTVRILPSAKGLTVEVRLPTGVIG